MYFGTASDRLWAEVEPLNGQGALTGIQPNQTPNAAYTTPAVSPWGISSMDERETAQTDG
jgi:hypothetical protein